MNDMELLNMAFDASKNAYAPHSGYYVGAAVECADGTIYTGCNVENSSFGATLCAERVAVSKAVSDGNRDFTRIAIYGSGADYCIPCGICRQFLSEFSNDIDVLCAKDDGRYVTYKLNQLLPYAFKFQGAKP